MSKPRTEPAGEVRSGPPPANELAALRSGYQQGTVTRDALWQGMGQVHAALLQYPPLLRDGDAARIEIDGEGLRLRLRNGAVFEWDPSDVRSPPNMVVAHGVYEPHELHLLEVMARGSRTVLDIGANIGWYAVQLARGRSGDRTFRLHAFEPVTNTHATLCRNIALNGVGAAVECHAFGFGEERATVTFYVPQGIGTPAASRVPLFDQVPQLEVRCALVRLDEWAAERGIAAVDMIKMDIEGSEIFALRGGMATLGRDRPAIFCEMLRKWAAKFSYHPNDIIALLAGIGYRCWGVSPAGLQPLAHVSEETVATNFVFLHPDRHGALAGTLNARPS